MVVEEEPVSRVGTATVLFTDLVGSTALRSRLGEESADKLAVAHERLLRRLVAEHQGIVIKGGGDGIMATFGAASDGVSAAVAIQQTIHRQSADRTDGIDLQVRAGLAVGDVTWVDGDCHGRPVIEAARLETAAGSAQILCTETVRLLAGGRGGHEFEPVGSLELKGIPDLVAVCEVVWQLHDAGAVGVPLPPALTAAANAPTFVGRPEQLAVLRSAYEQAASGRRIAVLVGGEPGVGKTRLVSEFGNEAFDRGAIVLHGGNDRDIHLPYGTLAEAIRHLVAAGGPEPVEGSLPPLEAVLQPPLENGPARKSTGSGSELEAGRSRLVDGIDRFLTATSEAGPVVLIAEDVQWAPESTLIALRRLVTSPLAARLLVVVTYRSADVVPGSLTGRFLADLQRTGSRRVDLAGLSVGELAELASETRGRLSDAELARLAELSGGNALYAGELLRASADLLKTGGGPLPPSVGSLVLDQVAGMPAGATAVLEAAAVLGDSFDLRLLEDVLVDDESVELVELAMAAGVVRSLDGSRMVFNHALVGAAIRDSLSPIRRRKLHELAAAALEQRRGVPAELARHRLAAARLGGDVEAAAESARTAASAAMSGFAFDEAVRLLQPILDLDSGELVSRTRCEILLEVGEAGNLMDAPAFAGHFSEAAELADTNDWEDLLVRAATGWGGEIGSWDLSRDLRGVALIRKALATTDPSDTGRRAVLTSRLAVMLAFREPVNERHRIAQEAVRLAEQTADEDLLSIVLARSMASVVGSRHPEHAVEWSDRLEAHARSIGDREMGAIAGVARANPSAVLGDGEGLRSAYEVTMAAYDSYGRAGFTRARSDALAEVPLAAAYLEGRLDDADEALVDHLSLLPQGGAALWFGLTFELSLRWAQLRPLAAIDVVTQGRALGGITTRLFHGWLSALEGDPQPAAATIERLTTADLDLHLETPGGMMVPWALCECVTAAPNPSHLAQAADWLQSLPDHMASAGWSFGPAYRYCAARVAHVSGDTDAADHLYTNAHRLHQELDARPLSARGLLDDAEFRLEIGHTNDARRLAADALAITAGTQMPELHDWAQRLLTRP